jgi:predicted adenine nucleotide alpha hydrolase (AANH) superfamily ATPase
MSNFKKLNKLQKKAYNQVISTVKNRVSNPNINFNKNGIAKISVTFAKHNPILRKTNYCQMIYLINQNGDVEFAVTLTW